jgi:photosystem II stability/assembly factor-like uncharacterized protein
VEWTVDGGATWTPASFPAAAGSGGFDFIDKWNGWFAASDLMRTRDGGATWQIVNDDALGDLDFVSATEGWSSRLDCGPSSVCDTAIIAHTTDAGVTWTEQARHFSYGSPRITFVDPSTGWVDFSGDVLLHTTDGGATWREQPLPPRAEGSSSPALAFVDPRTLWMAFMECQPGFTDCAIQPYVSIDGGDTWRAAARITQAGQCGVSDIAAVDARNAWVQSSECADAVRPLMHRTADGGATWRRIDLGGVGQTGRAFFFDTNVGRMIRAVCDPPTPGVNPCRDVLSRTADGGVTWRQEEMALVETQLYTYRFFSPEFAVRVVNDGGGLIAVSQQSLYTYEGLVPMTDRGIIGPDAGSGGSATARAGAPRPAPAAIMIACLAMAGAGCLLTGVGRRRA